MNDEPLDQLRRRPKNPIPRGKGRWMVGGTRLTPHGGMPRNAAELEAVAKLMEAREHAGPNLSGVMEVDSRWPLPFYNMDGTLENDSSRRDGKVSPLTAQEERDLMEVWGISEAEWIELMTREEIK